MLLCCFVVDVVVVAVGCAGGAIIVAVCGWCVLCDRSFWLLVIGGGWWWWWWWCLSPSLSPSNGEVVDVVVLALVITCLFALVLTLSIASVVDDGCQCASWHA